MADDDPSPAAPPASPLRILLVEDDEFDVAVFGRAFRKGGISCEIVRCRSSEEALEGLRDAELPIDLLVADHQLPGMSGFDLCVKLLEGEPPFALVLLTGGGSEQMAIRALRAGIQDYIVKDSSQEYLDLLPLVLPRVARRHRDRRGRRAPTPPGGSASDLADLAAAVQAHGGRIWVEDGDAPPTLHFSVPLAAEEVGGWMAVAEVSGRHLEAPPTPAGEPGAAGAEGEAGPAEPAGEKPRRVLIAHPNSLVTYVASQAAERCGCRFVVVENGDKAIEALDRESFDLVLMGVRMPALDGLEATRRIRAREGAAPGRLTIVALGADAEAGEVEECLEAGMDAAIPRPVEPARLHAALAGVPVKAPGGR